MGASTIKPPPPRDYAKETRETLEAQIDLAPQLYAAESAFSPLYNLLELRNLEESLAGTEGQRGLIDLYESEIAPSLDRIQREAQSTQRDADIADVERLAPRMRQALESADPKATALQDELYNQAMSELQAGERLAPDQMRDIQQQTRSAFSARGLNESMPVGISEIVNQQIGGQNLRKQRQAFAQSVAGNRQAAYGDPFMAILGRPSQTLAATQNVGTQGAMLGQAAGPQQFSPESAYAQDLYNTNLNMLWNTAAANADSKNAMRAARLAMYGQMASGAASGAGTAIACWVAREVYGNDNPKWLLFRTWVVLESPDWFEKFYIKHGEKFAGILRRNSWLKSPVRWVMDRILRKAQYGV